MTSRAGSFALAAAVTGAGMAALRARAPGTRARWERTNHAGRTVGLYAGPASAVGAAVGAARVHPAAGLAVLVAGACGAYDDVAGDHRRGFRAHLGALRGGEVTSGAVKLFGISAAGLLAGALMKERPADRMLAGVVIAGSAHFANLLDVRPGRTAGAVLALGVPGLLRKGPGGELTAAALGGRRGRPARRRRRARDARGHRGARARSGARHRCGREQPARGSPRARRRRRGRRRVRGPGVRVGAGPVSGRDGRTRVC